MPALRLPRSVSGPWHGLPVTERVCSDCEGLLVSVPDLGEDSDLDLMCVLCGAALSLGGLLLGELEALEEHAA